MMCEWLAGAVNVGVLLMAIIKWASSNVAIGRGKCDRPVSI
jgi:hypothetical protein